MPWMNEYSETPNHRNKNNVSDSDTEGSSSSSVEA